MPRLSPILSKARRALEDANLLRILNSEINHEVSTYHYQSSRSGQVEGFKVEYDAPESQDVVLRKKLESGEEVAVSALLGSESLASDCVFPRHVLMKVCLKKPGLSSILQFDCNVMEKQLGSSDFDIYSASFLQSMSISPSSAYKGPMFSSLDPQLQDALKEYLSSRGIGEELTNFLLLHLHKKELDQYVNWLKKLVSLVGKGE